MSMYTLFDKENLRITDYSFVGDLQSRLEQYQNLAAIEARPRGECLYVKHTENGWELDPDRKPEMPEPGCVWEYPRWVTLAEQRARYNAGLQAQMDALERKAWRPAREKELAHARPSLFENPVKTARAAVERMEQIEAGIAALRAQWWHADMAAPPAVLPT